MNHLNHYAYHISLPEALAETLTAPAGTLARAHQTVIKVLDDFVGPTETPRAELLATHGAAMKAADARCRAMRPLRFRALCDAISAELRARFEGADNEVTLEDREPRAQHWSIGPWGTVRMLDELSYDDCIKVDWEGSSRPVGTGLMGRGKYVTQSDVDSMGVRAEDFKAVAKRISASLRRHRTLAMARVDSCRERRARLKRYDDAGRAFREATGLKAARHAPHQTLHRVYAPGQTGGLSGGLYRAQLDVSAGSTYQDPDTEVYRAEATLRGLTLEQAILFAEHYARFLTEQGIAPASTAAEVG